MVAQIKDRSLRPEYARRLAGHVGLDVDEAMRAVAAASRSTDSRAGAGRRERPVVQLEPAAPDQVVERPITPRPDLRDPTTAMERQLLQCVLQAPWVLQAAEFDALGDDAFTAPMHRAVHTAVRSLGGLASAGPGWHERVAEAVPDDVRPYVSDLTVASLPVVGDDGMARLGASLQVEIAQRDLVRRERDVHSRMQRLDAAGDAVGYMAALREAQVLVERRRALTAQVD
jgi:DNA primase